MRWERDAGTASDGRGTGGAEEEPIDGSAAGGAAVPRGSAEPWDREAGARADPR